MAFIRVFLNESDLSSSSHHHATILSHIRADRRENLPAWHLRLLPTYGHSAQIYSGSASFSARHQQTYTARAQEALGRGRGRKGWQREEKGFTNTFYARGCWHSLLYCQSSTQGLGWVFNREGWGHRHLIWQLCDCNPLPLLQAARPVETISV